ncbi:hypothetical protein HYH03_018791 [Edaphochlamys debaryana]|uniref:BZIP domain-containing protein n=1 Tax=Edaphochlamys debaryana TaxID=47281 RepID=A0A836BMZ3_9CHLO|nr:hypothetical protein HYH03_018791 [Edaphochlamys debaryana]|eukprot:KAG2482277.1 hypothetical protein HYH03_018791 [Edaphochlamys debaryana]
MDGLGRQLFIGPGGSVYALVPSASEAPAPRRQNADDAVTQLLLAQFLQRQQQQELSLQLGAGLQDEGPAGGLDNDALLLQSILHAVGRGGGGMPPSAPLDVPLPRQAAPAPSAGRRVQVQDSPSNSDSQSPPPNGRAAHSGLGTASLSAKEKNRQAQRRFRERQKDLIANLKQRVEDLQNKVDRSEKEIINLKEENAMLRGRMEGGGAGGSVTLPAEALQSLLQLSNGAGGLPGLHDSLTGGIGGLGSGGGLGGGGRGRNGGGGAGGGGGGLDGGGGGALPRGLPLDLGSRAGELLLRGGLADVKMERS